MSLISSTDSSVILLNAFNFFWQRLISSRWASMPDAYSFFILPILLIQVTLTSLPWYSLRKISRYARPANYSVVNKRSWCRTTS